jgi:cell division protease FtsH
MNLEQLPQELSEKDALQVSYDSELSWISKKLETRTSVLVECEKQLIPWLYMMLRNISRERGLQMEYLDGRSVPGEDNPPSSVLRAMVAQITHWVRNSTEQTILVIPHLDLLTSNAQPDTLTTEAREIIPLLYENPRVVFLAFKDPNFSFFKVIENLFPAKKKLLGIDRKALAGLVLQREARKFPADFNLNQLYQYVSGLNPVRIREILSRVDGVDFPQDAKEPLQQIRELTADSDMELPNVCIKKDIGGYEQVKKQLNEELLSILEYREKVTSETELNEIDSIIPKGIIFHGPPGTGKTWFAKAMATALNATIIIVSGPELKSMWVGQSEENIRKVFFKARQSAPSIIVFDELDSFAGKRQSMGTTEVNHSMVNQLLTEMDGFRKEELVFVIGTTNFVESLDPALLRPGRFEFKIEIPFPNEEDRRDILEIYNKKLGLNISAEHIAMIAKKCGEMTDPMSGSKYTGDHLYSIMRFLKRMQIRQKKQEFSLEDLYFAMRGGYVKQSLSDKERKVVAVHEAGHAVVALMIKDSTPVERISVDSDFADFLGYVQQEDRKERFVMTRKQILSELVILMGGREAEQIAFQDISTGSENDLRKATVLVNEMVGNLGMSEAFGVRIIDRNCSEQTRNKMDSIISEILERARDRAKTIIQKHKKLLDTISNALMEKRQLQKEEVYGLLKTYLSKQNPEGAVNGEYRS